MQVRDELEHLLDDDEDMAEMYLTEKLEEQQQDNSSTSSTKEQDPVDVEGDRYVKVKPLCHSSHYMTLCDQSLLTYIVF